MKQFNVRTVLTFPIFTHKLGLLAFSKETTEAEAELTVGTLSRQQHYIFHHKHKRNLLS
jgi:hypothetical protein